MNLPLLVLPKNTEARCLQSTIEGGSGDSKIGYHIHHEIKKLTQDARTAQFSFVLLKNDHNMDKIKKIDC